MQVRIARIEDLEQIKAMYRKIIEKMYNDDICIWDDIYPCNFFKEDIAHNRLYVLEKYEVIVSAFALCDKSDVATCVEWENKQANAMYIDRLGVNVDYSNQGIGSITLDKAKDIAMKKGASYLRLFVVDSNVPAINLYNKNGFKRVAGVYEEIIYEDLTLREYGYEKRLESKDIILNLI